MEHTLYSISFLFLNDFFCYLEKFEYLQFFPRIVCSIFACQFTENQKKIDKTKSHSIASILFEGY